MYRHLTAADRGIWVIVQGKAIKVVNGELPKGSAAEMGLVQKKGRVIGQYNGDSLWLVEVHHLTSDSLATPRALIAGDPKLFEFAARGVQLAEFFRSHKWCGYCGNKMVHSSKEFACLCEHCHERYYPQIAPCVIVAVRKGTSILLARHARHRQPIYTVLAGFVESGETIEQAVHREVFEESQIQITRLRYVHSQPWPFPHSLMLGFMADYQQGQLQIDNDELTEAGWYQYDVLPKALPAVGTIARRLIEDTVAICRNSDNNVKRAADE